MPGDAPPYASGQGSQELLLRDLRDRDGVAFIVPVTVTVSPARCFKRSEFLVRDVVDLAFADKNILAASAMQAACNRDPSLSFWCSVIIWRGSCRTHYLQSDQSKVAAKAVTVDTKAVKVYFLDHCRISRN